MDPEKQTADSSHEEGVVKPENVMEIDYSPEEERKAVKKLDWSLIPLYVVPLRAE